MRRALLTAVLLVLGATAAYPQNGTVMPVPRPQFLDNEGDPCASCKLYTYEAGTSTPLDTYTNVALTTPHTNPIILNSAGRPSASGTETGVYLSANSYKFVLKTSADVTLWTQDNISATHASVTGVSNTGDLTFQVDTDNDGSNKFTFIDGTSVERASITEAGVAQFDGNVTIGDATEADKALLFDGNAQDYHVGVDDSADTLVIGRGTTLGTTTAIALATTGAMSFTGMGGCDLRLSLTTGVPVTTANVTAATTIYAVPYTGSGGPASCAFYDGSAQWWTLPVTEINIAVPATTATMYDVFIYNNAGTPTLELTAWTNVTTRATALTTQNGVYVKTGATTRRYLGSFCTTGVSGQTEDSASNRLVWNYYNRVKRPFLRIDDTNTWTYTTDTYRQANASAANQVAVVVGVAESLLELTVLAHASNSGVSVAAKVAIGEDSTSVPLSGSPRPWQHLAVANVYFAITASIARTVPVGYHYYAWLEKSAAADTTTWYGDDGKTDLQSGMTGWIEG